MCDTPLAHIGLAPVCRACWADLPPQSANQSANQFGTLCLGCGEALGEHLFSTDDRAPGDWLCRPCRVSPPAFERAVAHGLYGGTLRTLLHLLKYEGMSSIAGPLGAHMAAQVAALPGIPRSMTVVPVPLWAAKRRRRGFNQAELLARALSKAARRHGLELRVARNLLVRSRDTATQAGLSSTQRRRNLRAAFAVPGASLNQDKGAQPLLGRDILLVDDIFTTGATARAASSALRLAGAAQVWVSTAARVQRQELAEPVHAVETPMEEDIAFWG